MKSEEIKDRLERIETLARISLPLWTIDICARFMNVSEDRIRHLISEREFPCYKKLGKLYFKREEIEAWILEPSNRRKSKEEVNARAITDTVCADLLK